MKALNKVTEHYEAALKAIAKKRCEDASKHLVLANRFLGTAVAQAKDEPQGVQDDLRRTVDSVNRLGHRFVSFCACVRKVGL